MYKKILIVISVVLVIIAIIYVITVKDKKTIQNSYDSFNYALNNALVNTTNIQQITKNANIQGIVYLNSDGKIIMTDNQYFGELGYSIEEYDFAVINENNQICIDYFTLNKYDTSYIEKGDILICEGDLISYNNKGSELLNINGNEIIVLKESNYEKIKKETINNESNAHITIGDIYLEEYLEDKYIYLKYDVEEAYNSTQLHHFPFIQKAYITKDTQIIGTIEKGKKVNVKYVKPINYDDGLELRFLEII